MARGDSDNTTIIILIMLCVMCSISSVFGGAGIYLYLGKKNGDPCEGDDENAEYALDKDLKCRFTKCNTGYKLDENAVCSPIGQKKSGDICQGRYDNAMYEVGEDLNCDFVQCMDGYSFNDDERMCEVDEVGEVLPDDA
jgi:hypothetical protein